MIARILSSILVVALLGGVLGFAKHDANDRRVTGVKVVVKDESVAGFLSPQRIQSQLGTTRIEGERLSDIDLQKVVDNLLGMNPCARAEVYPTMDGTLHIDVWQRRPVLRVHRPEGNDYYLDEQGQRMDLDPMHSPHLPVMHAANESQARMAYDFVTSTREDSFWNALTDQLAVNEFGELILHPRLSGHEIVLGDASACEHKKRNLKAFYRAQVKRGNLRNIKRIDLTYRDQVIAQRYP